MTMSVAYGNFGGQLVHENRAGTKSEYVTDALGSTAAVLDHTGNATYEAQYWPYGEARIESGSDLSPWRYVGTLGYYVDVPAALIYVRTRGFTPTQAQWGALAPFWPQEGAYQYAFADPSRFSDSSGQWPHRPPTCQDVRDCLEKHSACLPSRGSNDSSIDQMLCVFWQESSFDNPPISDGIGSCTEVCFNTLKSKGCAWLMKFKDYNDWKNRATDCEKAQTAYDWLVYQGLSRYGPGPRRIGDYRGITGTLVRTCQDCLQAAQTAYAAVICGLTRGIPLPNPESDCSACLHGIHS